MGRLATDIGGTFTDLVYFDEDTGALKVAKSLSTPRDLTQGVIDTIHLSEIAPGDVTFFVHGGTTVINAITERKGVKTALVTTMGFRDVLEIARGNRPDMYNLRFQKPPPFVPRRLRFEVRERVDTRGEELEALVLADLDPVIEECRRQEVEAVAVQFLHSYAAPEHEAACRRIPARAPARGRGHGKLGDHPRVARVRARQHRRPQRLRAADRAALLRPSRIGAVGNRRRL